VRDWKNAITALEKCQAEAVEPYRSLNDFYVAMARWQLGQREEARQRYGEAAGRMAKDQTTDPNLLFARAEAAGLLGLPLPKPPVKPNRK
jgi:hypothetical protein